MLLSMRLLYLLNFLTFVLYLSPLGVLASPLTEARPQQIQNPLKTNSSEKSADPMKEQTTRISYPKNYDPRLQQELAIEPSPKKSQENLVIKSNKQKYNYLSLMGDSGYFIRNDERKNILLLNYKRIIASFDHAELVFGFGLSPQNISLMELGQRWNWKSWYSDEGSEKHSYISCNILNYIDASQMLAGLININHFKLQLLLGYDGFRVFSEDLMADIGVAFGVNGLSTSASLSWKF